MHLTQGLHRAVQQRPDAIATVCAGRVRSQAESVDRIARLAAALGELGIRNGSAPRSWAATPTATSSSSPPRCGPAAWSSR